MKGAWEPGIARTRAKKNAYVKLSFCALYLLLSDIWWVCPNFCTTCWHSRTGNPHPWSIWCGLFYTAMLVCMLHSQIFLQFHWRWDQRVSDRLVPGYRCMIGRNKIHAEGHRRYRAPLQKYQNLVQDFCSLSRPTPFSVARGEAFYLHSRFYPGRKHRMTSEQRVMLVRTSDQMDRCAKLREVLHPIQMSSARNSVHKSFDQWSHCNVLPPRRSYTIQRL